METRFVVRCDDVGQDVDQHLPDTRLLTFRRWLKAWGPIDVPLYLGVVPAVLDDYGREFLMDLEASTPVRLSIHGWDHKDQTLTPDDVKRGHDALPTAQSVIPPNNKYDIATFRAMDARGLRCLFGGFDGQHHQTGDRPVKVGGVLHVPAVEGLCRRSYALPDMLDQPWPHEVMQVVLHHRWDAQFIDGVRPLAEALKGRCVPFEAIPIP